MLILYSVVRKPECPCVTNKIKNTHTSVLMLRIECARKTCAHYFIE